MFSFQTRRESISRFKNEKFDLLVIGGGITGVATARDAASRGLRVALIEKRDFAWGTSSRSSKLVHGGLRYLENLEFKLVFEALSERSFLLKSAPRLVRPLPFYFPVYDRDPRGRFVLSLGLWLYDLLSLFRAPGMHRRLSKKAMLRDLPGLKSEGLKGGFRYYDASMWDDVLTVYTARSASMMGVAVANYVEAIEPIGPPDRWIGFRARDTSVLGKGEEFDIRAGQIVVCAGPWLDEFGGRMVEGWRRWLQPSKGVHLVVDFKRLPVPGALVMSHPVDGRISFVMPRPDLGSGVTIVGTTDGAASLHPEEARVDKADIDYLLGLLKAYFPNAGLSTSDILSTYVGVRPLISGGDGGTSLKEVSREHFIGEGPGSATYVAGGKYTTHRTMALEIVDHILEKWSAEAEKGGGEAPRVGKSKTRVPVNPSFCHKEWRRAQGVARSRDLHVEDALWERYGADALEVMERVQPDDRSSADGFPRLEAQLRYAIREEMVLRLEDFCIRRVPLYLSRGDHGSAFFESLSQVWAKELGASDEQRRAEIQSLVAEVQNRSS